MNPSKILPSLQSDAELLRGCGSCDQIPIPCQFLFVCFNKSLLPRIRKIDDIVKSHFYAHNNQ